MPIDLNPLPDAPIVHVRSRSDTELPFSKGILATSLLATGMRTEEAYHVATVIGRTLVGRGLTEIRSGELAELVAETIASGPGPTFAKRYVAWRRTRRSGRPIVIALAGVSGVGKSTIAARLGLRLGISRVLTTDVIREVLRTVVPTTVLPELHVSSFERSEVPAIADPEDGFALQMRAVHAGSLAVAQRLVAEGHDVILEGVHVEPGAMRRGLEMAGSNAIVIERLLTLEDVVAHEARLVKRRRDAPARRGARHLEHLHRIRDLQDRLQGIARSEGVREHDVLAPGGLTAGIVDEITYELPVEEAVLA